MGRMAELSIEMHNRWDLMLFDMTEGPEPEKPAYVRPPYAAMTPELKKRVEQINTSEVCFWTKILECCKINIDYSEQMFYQQG